jgi:hypothetical protein
MEIFRRINISLAVFVAICFFLPWIQVSCGGAHDTESGLDLARHGERLLWLVPLMMVVIVALGVGAGWSRRTMAFALASLIGGAATFLLMNRERPTDGGDGLIPITVTPWFWLGFIAAIVIAIGGLALLLQRPPKESG